MGLMRPMPMCALAHCRVAANECHEWAAAQARACAQHQGEVNLRAMQGAGPPGGGWLQLAGDSEAPPGLGPGAVALQQPRE